MIKLKRLGYKKKESPYLNKVSRIFRNSYYPSHAEVLFMKGSWENNPMPLYVFLCISDKYGKIPNKTYGISFNEIMEASSSNKFSNLFYEKFLGYLTKGYEKYSHKDFRNLRELNASLTEQEINESVEYIAKAIALNPHFDNYLKEVESQLSDKLNNAINTARKDELTVYSKYFNYLKGQEVSLNIDKKIPKSLYSSVKDLTEEEKCLVSFINGTYSEDKIKTKKVKDFANQVLLKLIEIRPDAALNYISPSYYLNSSSDDVKSAYVDLVSNNEIPTKLNGSPGLWDKNWSRGDFDCFRRYKVAYPVSKVVLTAMSNNETAYDDVAQLLLNVKQYEYKNLKPVLKQLMETLKGEYIEGVAVSLHKKQSGFDKAFLELYKDTRILKNAVRNVKGVPDHLKVEAFFNPTSTKDELLKENVNKVKVTDITKEMAKSTEFWVSYVNCFKKNVDFSSEIAKKMTNAEDKKAVAEALIVSKEPVSAVYLKLVDFGLPKEQVDEIFYTKTLDNPRTVLIYPEDKIKMIEERSLNASVKGFFNLLQEDNAFKVMTKTSHFAVNEKYYKKVMLEAFIKDTDETNVPSIKKKLK